jgi:flagellar basal-body rod protein FlgG
MLRALYSSATGMQSQQTNLDVIANNLANVSTNGFKKSKPEFQDLLYTSSRAAGADAGAGNQVPAGVDIGHGSRLVSTAKVFTQGELAKVDGQLNVAISGEGFFEVQTTDGNKAYTRDGSFQLDKDGRVVTNDGLVVQSGFGVIPLGTTDITISRSGQVTTKSGITTTGTFNVQLSRFVNPAGLKPLGGNLYAETESSGTAEAGNPGENGMGKLEQGFLEVNSKAVQAADEMMQLSNNMIR